MLDNESTTTSELLQTQLPTSTVVKAFNHIAAAALTSEAEPQGTANRRALVIAGDDAIAKAKVAALIDQFGFDVVDAGPLREGWRIQRDTPGYGPRRTAAEIRAFRRWSPEFGEHGQLITTAQEQWQRRTACVRCQRPLRRWLGAVVISGGLATRSVGRTPRVAVGGAANRDITRLVPTPNSFQPQLDSPAPLFTRMQPGNRSVSSDRLLMTPIIREGTILFPLRVKRCVVGGQRLRTEIPLHHPANGSYRPSA